MQRLVVDSGVVVKWFVREQDSERAGEILKPYENGSLRLLAPDLVHAELANILWKKCRQGLLAPETGRAILETFWDLRIPTVPAEDLLAEAFLLATTHDRTVYDSLYIALSLRERCPFVTADDRLANAVSRALPNVVRLVDWQRLSGDLR